MLTPGQVGRDTTIYVTEEQFRTVRGDVVRKAREKVVARNILPIVPLANWGEEQYKWYADVDISPPFVGMTGSHENADMAAISPTTVDIPVIHKDFFIRARQLAASQNGQTPLDTRSARLASERVALKEEEIIWAGVSVGDDVGVAVTGLISDAQSGGTGTDWGSGTIATDVANCKSNLLTTIHALRTDFFYGPYYCILTKGAEVALWQTVPDTGGQLLRKFAEDLFTLGVYGSDQLFPAVASSTEKMLVGEPGPDNHGMIMAQDIETIILDDSFDMLGKVFEAAVAETYRGNSLAAITSIDSID